MAQINIGGTLHSTALGPTEVQSNIVTNADEVLDVELNKKQDTINSELTSDVSGLKTAVGTGGSVDSRIASAKTEILGDASTDYNTLGKIEDSIESIDSTLENAAYLGTDSGTAVITGFDPQSDTLWKKAQVLSTAQKNQVKVNLGLDSDFEVVYSLYRALNQSDIIVGAKPSTGNANTIYRVPGESSYTDWMYYNNSWVEMATYNNAIDDEPTAGSDNLVKSGGVYEKVSQVEDISETVSGTESSIFYSIPFLKNGKSITIKLATNTTSTCDIGFWTALNGATTLQNFGRIKSIGDKKTLTLTQDANGIYIYNYGGSGSYSFVVIEENLYSDVNDLKEEVSVIHNDVENTNEDLTLYYDSTTYTGSATNFNVDFLKVGTEITVKLVSDSYNPCDIGFWTSDSPGHTLESFGRITEIGGTKKLTLTQDANHIYTYNYKGSSTTTSFEVFIENTQFKVFNSDKKVQNLQSDIDDLDSEISEVENQLTDYSATDIYTGGQTDFNVDFLKVGRKISIKILSNTTDPCDIMFYATGGDGDEYIGRLYKIGDVLEKVLVGNHTQIYTYNVKGSETTEFKVWVVNFESRFSDLEDTNSELEQSVFLISEKFDFPNTKNLEPIYLERGTINMSTGENQDSTTGIRSDFFPCTQQPASVIVFNSLNTQRQYGCGFNYYDSNKQYLGYIFQSGTAFARMRIDNVPDDQIVNIRILLKGSVYRIGEYIKNLTLDNTESFGLERKIAVGNLTSNGSYESELEASPIQTASLNLFRPLVKFFKSNKRSVRENVNFNVVAINHDDLQYSDWQCVEPIYNKYGFNANFNFILPYDEYDLIREQERRRAIKEMINDGNDIGIHSILGKSYWYINKCFDIRPDSTFTFAPTLSQIKGSNQDGTGDNSFGVTISATTKASELYLNIPSGVTNPNVVEMTEAQLSEVTRCFTIYGDYQYLIYCFDLEDNRVQKTTLQWLEYWYNNFIDSTLGYSSTETSIADKFAEDYDYPEGGTLSDYYPDAEHLINGKIVFYDDTTNPNYDNPDYQKVGRFKKGLFKGCASCCNYEVFDRCIDVATAYCRYYFGLHNFTNIGEHGIGYFLYYWKDSSTGISYDDYGRNIISDDSGRLYFTREQVWQSQLDVLLARGIRNSNYRHPITPVFEGPVGLFYGMKEIRGEFFSHARTDSGAISYLNFFGNTESESMSYANFSQFLNNQDNWIKFAYEKAGQSITQNELTYTVFTRVKHFIDVIRACKDTGKIPLFSYDTVVDNPAIHTAVNLILRFCYENSIKVVPLEKARELAASYKLQRNGNLFPNSSFNQNILKYLGGSSTSKDAYIPDSWYKASGSFSNVVVTSQTIDSKTRNVLGLSTGNSSASLQCKIWGLEPGTYELSYYAKSTTNAIVEFFVKKNGDYLERNLGGIERFTPVDSYSVTGSWVKHVYEFTINEFHRNASDATDAVNIICNGYEDNVSNVVLLISLEQNKDIEFTSPKIKLKDV